MSLTFQKTFKFILKFQKNSQFYECDFKLAFFVYRKNLMKLKI